jgi:hypothetical protein
MLLVPVDGARCDDVGSGILEVTNRTIRKTAPWVSTDTPMALPKERRTSDKTAGNASWPDRTVM